jgi:hypothetical protein
MTTPHKFTIGTDFEPLPVTVRTRESIYPWDKIEAPREHKGQTVCAYFDVHGVNKKRFDQNVSQRNSANKKKGNPARFKTVATDHGVRVYRVA